MNKSIIFVLLIKTLICEINSEIKLIKLQIEGKDEKSRGRI